MEMIEAPWDEKNLITEFGFLSDDGTTIEFENNFAFYCNKELIQGCYVGNKLTLKGFNSENTAFILKHKFLEMAKDVENLHFDFVWVGMYFPSLVVKTYWKQN